MRLLTDSKKHGHEIRVVRILTDRILKDEYSNKYFKASNSDHFRHHEYLKQQDIDYLFKLMSRKIRFW